MRISHVISMPAAGGAETFVRDLAIEMATAGHDVHVMFLESAIESGRDPAFAREFLASLKLAGVEVGFLGRRCRRNPFAGIRRMRAHVKMWAPDVIHAHLYYGAIFAAFTRSRLIYTHHNIVLRVPKALYRWFLDRHVRAYVGICDACTRMLRSVSRGRVVRIDNAVSPHRILARASGDARRVVPRVISVGRLSAQKDYAMLLRAVSTLDDLDFTLKIVGEGPERNMLERLVSELHLDHKVALTGNSTQVAELLSRSDLFVMSSAWEGLPIALIEATLAGLPVLVTNVGGCSEVVRETGNGVVVDPGNPVEYAVHLRELLESPGLREALSKNARENSGRYRLDVAVDRHLALYSQVIRDAEAA